MIIVLKSLKLKNFKGITALSINFSKVTNIFGENATGKTTIFDSFTWLLFNKDSQDRAKFDIQPLDSENKVEKMIETEVEATLLIDSTEFILKKVLTQNWVKKRGEVEAELKGGNNSYYINEVPVKEGEYKKRINEIIEENIFKLITNPLYFSTNMKWQDRRGIILKIVGDITNERIISSHGSLEGLSKLLINQNVDDVKKSTAAKKKKLIEDKKSIPYRVDELNNSIKEYDFESLEFQKRNIQSAINSIDEKLMDSSKANEGLLKEQDRLYKLKSKLKDIEYKAKSESELPLREMTNNLYKVKSQIQDINYNQIRVLENRRDNYSDQIINLKTEMDHLRNQWTEKNNEQLIFDESKFNCPTCNRPLEEHDIETTKHEMLENFNLTKARALKSISEKGTEKKKKVSELESLINALTEELIPLNEKIVELESKQLELEADIKSFKPSLNLDSNKEYQEILSQISTLESKLQQPRETNNNQELKNKKYQLQADLEQVNKQLAAKEQNEIIHARKSELLDQEKSLAQQIADLEKTEYLCEEFIKAKVNLLENSINEKFRYVTFKLFETQVNGGINECCEALVNGVPFSNANTASQYNAGLDIINALSEYYNVEAPIFIDNRESVNQLIDIESQIINLIVSTDKSLKIENLESEVA
ncbi:DUF2813 domain-containing protein [Clostridium sp. UBA1652]|uniref:DUF2813 domain-containing protein n=1 Tax=Clostridium sp. UBA1652 TaxID=1946348 RepID=UPI00257FFEDC|nr:AAA family ATPase [Clostridium sp. UBA1652]